MKKKSQFDIRSFLVNKLGVPPVQACLFSNVIRLTALERLLFTLKDYTTEEAKTFVKKNIIGIIDEVL